MTRTGRLSRWTGAGLSIVVTTSLLAAPPALAKAKNANFVGTWTPNTGVGWTITRENARTGACAGYSALRSSGYGLVSCRVSGHHYRFVITDGGYRSVNTGTLRGNALTGSFNDGGVNPYTARRTKR